MAVRQAIFDVLKADYDGGKPSRRLRVGRPTLNGDRSWTLPAHHFTGSRHNLCRGQSGLHDLPGT
jgi:hypothetical protein